MRRRNVPCSPCSGGSSGSCDCCGIKEKLRILWDRTIGSILRINGVTPDGDGDFTIEAGDNIALSQVGTGNGIRIDTTGAVAYYSSGDSYVNVDNNDLEITVNVGTGGLATDTDLQTVAGAVSDILDGTTTVPKATDATNAQYLGDSTSNVGNDTQPVKIVNGVATPVTSALMPKTNRQSGTRVYYQQINNKTYLCWGWNSINVVYDTRTEITITYPVTPDNASNVFPVITSISAPSYFGDCVFTVSDRIANGFKVQSMGNYNGMGTVSATISWMAVITTA